MATKVIETENSDVDELVRQVWPWSWEHKAKMFLGSNLEPN